MVGLHLPLLFLELLLLLNTLAVCVPHQFEDAFSIFQGQRKLLFKTCHLNSHFINDSGKSTVRAGE